MPSLAKGFPKWAITDTQGTTNSKQARKGHEVIVSNLHKIFSKIRSSMFYGSFLSSLFEGAIAFFKFFKEGHLKKFLENLCLVPVNVALKTHLNLNFKPNQNPLKQPFKLL